LARTEQLQKILEARYELDYAPRELKATRWKILMTLVDEAIVNTHISRNDLLATLHDRYIEFKRERRKKEKVQIAQRLQG
jgi:hypothetical protein